jgi:hypothetical protein
MWSRIGSMRSFLEEGAMRHGLMGLKQLVALVLLAVGLVLTGLGGDGARADEVRQLKLTDQQIAGFVASQKDLAGFAEKLQAAGDKLDPQLKTELDGIAVKHGFKDFAELDDVAANISIVMAGIDPQTGEYVDPVTSLKQELDDVKKDETIAADEKTQLINELEEAIRSTPALENKENIGLVVKNREAIEKALE